MGFLFRAGNAAVPVMPMGLPDTSETVVACPPPFGEPVAFDISSSIPESEAPGMSFLLVPLPSGMMLMLVSSSAQTVLSPGFPSQSGRWSLAIPQTHKITREGPFDAYFLPMDTGDYPLVSAGLPGCTYRFTSYTAPTVADTDTAFSIQLHNPRFLAGVPFPGVLGSSPGPGGCYRGHYQSTTRCRVDVIESAGFKSVCDFVGQNVVGGVSVVRSVGTVSYSSCYVGGPLYGFYGIMATYSSGPGPSSTSHIGMSVTGSHDLTSKYCCIHL